MCLLKVYLDEGVQRKIVAEKVAFVVKEHGRVKLRSVEFKETILDDVDISLVDTLNGVLTLKPRG